jgi:hypothetical protein
VWVVEELEDLDLALDLAHHVEILHLLSIEDLDRDNVASHDMLSPWDGVEVERR